MLQLICDGQSNRAIAAKLDLSVEHRRRASRQHHEHARHPQDRRARRLRHPPRPGEPAVNRRDFLCRLGAAARRACRSCRRSPAQQPSAWISGSSTSPPACGHRSSGTTAAPTAASSCPKRSAPAARFSTTTATAGRTSCSSTAWTGRATSGSARRCACTATTATARSPTSRGSAGLDVELYGMGVAVGDCNNDGFPDLLITCVGQNRLFRNTGKGTFVDVTRASGLGGRTGFSTSALWFDFDRDGWLDLFVCNYVKWSAEHDVFCSLDGKQKSYCTPEAYRGDTCWLFRNRGNGTFEDVTATSGIFDTSSKSLGVAHARLRPGRLARSVRRQRHAAQQALSQPAQRHVQGGRRRGRASRSAPTARRAPAWASTPPTSTTRARPSLAITNFDNEMIGLYRPLGRRDCTRTSRCGAGVGAPSRNTLGFGCVFADIEPGRRARSRRRQRAHRRDRAQHPRQRRLRAAAAAVPESGQRHVSRRRGGSRRRISRSRRSDAAWRTAISTATAISIC